jgi:hypothetical protein
MPTHRRAKYDQIMDASSFDAQGALEFLRARNVNLQEFARNDKAFERTCKVVYKALPLPVRLALGRHRVEAILARARDLYLASQTEPTASSEEETNLFVDTAKARDLGGGNVRTAARDTDLPRDGH